MDLLASAFAQVPAFVQTLPAPSGTAAAPLVPAHGGGAAPATTTGAGASAAAAAAAAAVRPTPADVFDISLPRWVRRAAADVVQAKLHVSRDGSAAVYVRLQLLSLAGGDAHTAVVASWSRSTSGVVLHTCSGVHVGLYDARAAAAAAEATRLVAWEAERAAAVRHAQMEADEWMAVRLQLYDIAASESWSAWRRRMADRPWDWARPEVRCLAGWLQPPMHVSELECLADGIEQEAVDCEEALFDYARSGMRAPWRPQGLTACSYLWDRIVGHFQAEAAREDAEEAARQGRPLLSPTPLRNLTMDQVLYHFDRGAYYQSLNGDDGVEESSTWDEFVTCSDFTHTSAPHSSHHLETPSPPPLPFAAELSALFLPGGRYGPPHPLQQPATEEAGGGAESSTWDGIVTRSEYFPIPAPHVPYQSDTRLPPQHLPPSDCVAPPVVPRRGRDGARG